MSTCQHPSVVSRRKSGGCLQLNADNKEDFAHLKQINRKALKRLRKLTIIVPWGNTKHKKHQVFMYLNDMIRYLRDKLTPGQTAMDYTFGISIWSRGVALGYLEPLRNFPQLASLRIKTVAYRSTLANEGRLAFNKHGRNLAHKVVSGREISEQQLHPSASLPSAEPQTQGVFPFAKLPLENQDTVLEKTSLASPPHRGIQMLAPAYADIPRCYGKCGPGLRCWCPTEAAYSQTCKCNPSTSSFFLVDHGIRTRSQNIY